MARMRTKPAFVEREDGTFIKNDDSSEARVARALQRRNRKAEREDSLAESIALLRFVQEMDQSEEEA
jgi:hypothetical protein